MIKSMSKMRKMLWSKLGMSFGKKGRQGKTEDMNSQKGKPSVNDEYNEAFRTKSYVELRDKVKGQLETRSCPDEGQSSASSSHNSPSHKNHVHLFEFILDPPQETLNSIIENSNLHRLLVDYFDTSREASEICELVLQNAHQAGINYCTVKNAINLIEQFPDSTRWTHNQHDALYTNLVSITTHEGPFSSTHEKFLEPHDRHTQLLHQLTSKYQKTKRRANFIKYVKRAFCPLVVVGPTALAIALLGMLGMLVAPGLILCCLAFFMVRKLKGRKRKSKRMRLEGLGAQLDMAARGLYTLMNDFDTMDQLVKGLNDEIERRKTVVESCVNKRKDEILKEVVREFQMHESCFLGQLEELKKHVYLCFLNVNRARRLLVQEMV